MKYSNNNGNERGSAVPTKAPDPVTDQDQRVILTAAETIVKIEPLKAPETEEKSSQAPEQALDESKSKPNKSKRLMIVAGLGGY
ncbi:hypothetical protein [Nostoc sp.]|uniref:hypothetical protein n=1 Tax=Nostoc sp. TaxID=1180 RepID=UPI002FF8295F